MVFNKETEQRIVNIIKKSPLGVSSSEIADSIGLNRMTITKYLAIIREKALIDFKQFGMAKLWYIPVNISKESFLSKIMVILASNLEKSKLNDLSEKIGIEIGEEMNQLYLDFYDSKHLSATEIVDSFEDMGKKLGGEFVVEKTADKLAITITKHPFEESKNVMNVVLGAVFAKMVSLNFDKYKKTVIEEKDGNVVIGLVLK